MNTTRIIKTGLVGRIGKDILEAVMGQLSDGKWENSPGMEKYWEYASINTCGNDAVILIDDGYGSGYRGKNDAWVKNYFANKIKQVAYDELGGGQWDRMDNTKLSYLSQYKPITVAYAYYAYDVLKGRSTANKNYAFQAWNYAFQS